MAFAPGPATVDLPSTEEMDRFSLSHTASPLWPSGGRVVQALVRLTPLPFLVTAALGLLLQTPSAHGSAPAAKKPKSSLLQDYFPFQGACISVAFPTNNFAIKGLAIRVGSDAAIV